MMDVNVFGVMCVLLEVVLWFVVKDVGYIVLIGLFVVYYGLSGVVGYSISKVVLMYLVENFYLDLRFMNVWV